MDKIEDKYIGYVNGKELASQQKQICDLKIALGKIIEIHDWWHNRNCHVKTELRNAILEASELLTP